MRRHPRSPRANRDSYGLVQGRQRRRAPGKPGLAHFLERLIFKATTNRANSEFTEPSK
ncbi:insulinase family protein [Mesorhizobium opportunistum]|uniref:insulinase family protein n=1 Tax=Mesorhizobium opportunistum TaxID=593909 RepID=UPI003DA1BA82